MSPRQKAVETNEEYTCKHCGTTHNDYVREEYDSAVIGITICEVCQSGDDTLQAMVEETV